MTTLHTFGCSITQGFALPDVVRTLTDDSGVPLTNQQIIEQGIDWSEIHIYKPSEYAWPTVLARKLGLPVNNYARRGACFQQIARQCVTESKNIKQGDIVIVMWTYLSRLSLQWPARTAMPFATATDPKWNWRTMVVGINKAFGLERSKSTSADQHIQEYIHNSLKHTYLDPLGIYNRYYNNLVLQSLADGYLRSTGARVIHLSVEAESGLEQLESARSELDPSLREPYVIPDPESWYLANVDYNCCPVILDPSIPLAENDMHPSVTHHKNFAEYVYNQYFL